MYAFIYMTQWYPDMKNKQKSADLKLKQVNLESNLHRLFINQ